MKKHRITNTAIGLVLAAGVFGAVAYSNAREKNSMPSLSINASTTLSGVGTSPASSSQSALPNGTQAPSLSQLAAQAATSGQSAGTTAPGTQPDDTIAGAATQPSNGSATGTTTGSTGAPKAGMVNLGIQAGHEGHSSGGSGGGRSDG